ncbi:MAG TPA: PAS domain-containing protein [Urbifossiella sp.]|nr:PAS domain-containing protein [Urbifossiella sp.]
MPAAPRKRPRRYAAAAAGVVLAALVRWLLDPVVGDNLPFLTFFAATLVAAWYGGFGPALLTVGLGAAVATVCFVPPRGSLVVEDPRTLFVLVLYVGAGVLFAAFGEAVLAARRRAAASAADAARRRDELVASERRFRALTTHAPVGIFETDPDGRCVFVNDRWCRITGLSAAEAAGDGWARALHPDDRERVRDEWYAAAAAGREFVGKYRFLTPQGATVWVRGNAVALRDEAGALTGHLGTVTDITAERTAADAVRESELRLRTLSDNLPDGAVYQTTGDAGGGRRFVYISAGVERLFGVTPAEVMADAAALYGLVHADDRPRLAAAEEAALRGMGPFDCEFRSHTRGGGVRWVHCRSAPRLLPTGETVWEGIVMDVTARRRSEQEARVQRDRLDLVVNSVDVGLWYCDLPFDQLVWNAKVKEHFGLPADADVTMDTFYERLHPADRDRTREAIQRSIRDHTGYDIEYRTVGLDGRERWVRAIGRTFYAPSGEPVSFDGVTVDVTERVRQVQALRDADRRKDEFLATLAHELRNPLAPLRTGLRVVRMSRDDPATADRVLGMMERQLGHLVHLVDDLLDVSRITRGRLRLRLERVELAAVVGTAVEASRPAVEAAGHRLAVSLPPEPVWLDADPTRLTQVLANLLTNAAKYTDPGGDIALTAVVKDEGGRMKDEANQPEGSSSSFILPPSSFPQVEVAVRDTGIGVAAEHLPGLFEMFSQVVPAHERAQGGLGIGLALVKGLVEMHDGTIEARSDGPGRGSEFVVRLPLGKEEGGRRKEEPESAPVPPSSFPLPPS